MSETIVAKLEQLSEMQNAADVLRLDYEAKRQEILRAVQAELDALADEYQPLVDTLSENIESLTDEIRGDVLAHGATVKCERLQAVYMRGRVSWDTRALDHYAESHPDVQAYRREGEPRVQLRVVK
ncbi:MAG: hypothetical protein LC737_05850 [Chloroflexi bacterium]|nr:hypothetical protein [Chloroflexota bacterium]